MSLDLNRYAALYDLYVKDFGNARMRSEARTLRYCMRINYKATRDITEELIRSDELPSIEEMEAALVEFKE